MPSEVSVGLGSRAGTRHHVKLSILPRLLTAIRHTLWDGRSIRARLLIVFVLIDVLAVLIAGAVTILKARTATRVEIAAGLKVAELLVTETLSTLREDVAPEPLLRSLPLQLRFLRHVRIIVTDGTGTSLGAPARPPAGLRGEEHRAAPALFEALIAPPPEQRELPVVVAGRRIASVWVVGEPSDEIAEVWGNTLALGAVGAAVNLAVIGILYVLFGRVLVPLTGLAGGLLDLERQNYSVRLPRPRARELAVITDRFNALAEALEGARAENTRLTHRLITAQDDERRRTALELHDEVGPCLFGLKANASSLASAIHNSPDPAANRLADRVCEILAIVDRLQILNRSLLNRLRPMALGHVPLHDLLADVVRDRAHQHPQISFAFSAQNLKPSYNDSVDLTVYRCVQESLTNAIRHAQAKNVTVEINGFDNEASNTSAGARLLLIIRDDGRGISADVTKGFGLPGMEERVRALGGEFRLKTADGGTRVEISMPIEHHGSDPLSIPIGPRQ
jgi:two-component system, NarL family, sensor histidine kinase UhpB